MKIAIISPNRHHQTEMGKLLEEPGYAVQLFEGGLARMRQVADQVRPDLLLVEGMCCSPQELAQVEYLGQRFPALAVILVCASQSPEFLLCAMRAGVREVLPSPAPPAALLAAVGRAAARLGGGRVRGQGRIMAFMPCKGGVGATFLAANLGYQLSMGASVLLLDLNLQFGDALACLHDEEPACTIADLCGDIGRLDADFLDASCVKVAPGYAILAAPRDPALALGIRPEHIDAILSVAAERYDFILADLGRTLDPVNIRVLDRAERIYLVLQAALPGLRNATRLLAACKALGYPDGKTELIVNRYEKGGEIGLDAIRGALGKLVTHTVPNSYREVNASINHGDALFEMAGGNAVSRCLGELARSLAPGPAAERSLFDRLFNRA